MVILSAGKDSYKEKWEGARTSYEDIVMHFKADDAQPITAFPSVLKSLASAYSNVYLDVPEPKTGSRRGRGLSHKALLKVLVVHSLLVTYYLPTLSVPVTRFSCAEARVQLCRGIYQQLKNPCACARGCETEGCEERSRATNNALRGRHQWPGARKGLLSCLSMSLLTEGCSRLCVSQSQGCQSTVSLLTSNIFARWMGHKDQRTFPW